MATNPVGPAANEVLRLRDNRWLILFFSVLSMVAVANFQYGWTLFVPPLQKHLGVDQSVIQVTFTVFVAAWPVAANAARATVTTAIAAQLAKTPFLVTKASFPARSGLNRDRARTYKMLASAADR